MTPNQEGRFRQIVAEHLGVDIGKVTDNANFINDLGADSLDVFELAMAAEEEFDIEVDQDLDNVLSVGDALAYLRGRLS